MAKKYKHLKPPKSPKPDGLFALKAKHKTSGCLVCKKKLPYKMGRPRVICEKKACFLAYRTAYRRDYSAAAA